MDLSSTLPAWVREEAPSFGPGRWGRVCKACGWWKPAGPESTRGTKRGEVTEGFNRKAGSTSGLREICRECRKPAQRDYITAIMDDPEQRAKETLRQRAKQGRLAWPLWRELREKGQCAAFLAAHPFTNPPRGPYGYVYVLMTFTEEVLYVGQTINVENRLFIQASAHKFDKEWFEQVAIIDVYTYHSEDHEEAERWLIQTLKPVYNKQRPKPRRAEAPTPLSVVRGVR